MFRDTNRTLESTRPQVFCGRARLNLLVAGCWLALAGAAFYGSTVTVAGEALTDETSPSAALTGGSLTAVAPLDELFASSRAEAGGAKQPGARFSHAIQGHAALSCLMCHRRDTNAARPQMPGHSPCAGCHAPVFNDPQAVAPSPMCAICHTGGGANPAVKAFPRLRSFNVKFSHAVHNRRGAAPREGCAACHQPQQRGAARSIPQGFAAHNNCYTCHTSRATVGGRDISSCGTCHETGRFAPVANDSKAYRVGFSHAEHATQSCATCHTIRAGARGNQVSETTAAMHFPPARQQSCATCHDNKRAFGGTDFADCKRCHTGSGFRF